MSSSPHHSHHSSRQKQKSPRNTKKQRKKNDSEESRHHNRHKSHSNSEERNHSRSRQKSHKKHSKNHGNQRQNRSLSMKQLQRCNHYSFIPDDLTSVTENIAICNSIVLFARRPKLTLIICENEKKLAKFLKSENFFLKRSYALYSERQEITTQSKSENNLKNLIQNYQVILITQKQCSILLAKEQTNICFFDLVVNAGHSFSIQFYSLLGKLVTQQTEATILTIFQEKKDLQRHQRKLKLAFKQFTGQLKHQDLKKQILSDIQFTSKPSFQDFPLLKTLPFSLEQTSVRLFSLFCKNYTLNPSKYLQKPGFVTYCLQTEAQFNSIKYIWNFLRQQMSPNTIKGIRDMRKFDNQRGVLFNVPKNDQIKWQNLYSKIQKNQKKYKGYKLHQLIGALPKLQDTQSEQYKIQQAKKQSALKNRSKLELFIAGIPYDATQVSIRKFFSQHKINLFLIRILRDSSGFSKGIAFGLAEDQQHFQRAMNMTGQKFGQRVLRIKIADQKEHK